MPWQKDSARGLPFFFFFGDLDKGQASMMLGVFFYFLFIYFIFKIFIFKRGIQ